MCICKIGNEYGTSCEFVRNHYHKIIYLLIVTLLLLIVLSDSITRSHEDFIVIGNGIGNKKIRKIYDRFPMGPSLE